MRIDGVLQLCCFRTTAGVDSNKTSKITKIHEKLCLQLIDKPAESIRSYNTSQSFHLPWANLQQKLCYFIFAVQARRQAEIQNISAMQ